jgi:hypothetical protein
MPRSRMPLLVLENGDKYIIRGRGRFDCAPDIAADDTEEVCTGEMNVDQQGKPWPAVFLAHAKNVWVKAEVEVVE